MTFFEKHKYDLFVIAAVLLIAGALFGYTILNRTPGAEVVITIDGEEFMRLDLNGDASVTVGEGEHQNVVSIKNGAVCVSEASCPDHVCMNSGWKKYDGETIVCLPNKLVVTVEGGEDAGLDAVAG